MHDFEIVVIWFSLVIAGMILTMLMPWIVSEPRGGEIAQDECVRIPAYQGLHERASTMIPIGTEV